MNSSSALRHNCTFLLGSLAQVEAVPVIKQGLQGFTLVNLQPEYLAVTKLVRAGEQGQNM
eukprot:689415-Pelagomonas_calceolata.AAC.1